MSLLIGIGAVAFAAFLLSYIRPGRYGAMAMAFGVGQVLAHLWTDELVAIDGLSVPFLSLRDAVYCVVVLAPGLFALVFAQKQKSLLPRLVGAIFSALFVVLLLYPVLVSLFGESQEVSAIVSGNRDYGITGLLLVGLLDGVFSRPQKAPKRSKD